MRILFVRHGHPNYEKDCLTELGHLHAEAAAKRLLDEGVEQIYSSTCGRAMETAEHLAVKLGLEVIPCDFMREIIWGAADGGELYHNGHPWDCVDRMVSEGMSVMDTDWTQGPFFRGNRATDNVLMIGRELDRLLGCLGYTREGMYYRVGDDTRRTVAVFSHGGASSAMLSHLFNLPFPFVCAAMGPDYTAVTAVTLGDAPGEVVTPRFELLGDARHIRGLDAQNIFGR